MAKDPSMVIIRGRLAADPELRTVGAQATPVVNLRILSSGWEKDTAGQPVESDAHELELRGMARSGRTHRRESGERLPGDRGGKAEDRPVHRAGRHGAMVHEIRHRRHRCQPAARHRADHENKRWPGNGGRYQAAPTPAQGYAGAVGNDDDFDTGEW